MNDIVVSIQGIVMIVSAAIYPSNPTANTNPGAALAVRWDTDKAGTYGVTIPAHIPQLRVFADDVDGTLPTRFKPNRLWMETTLLAERVQFGRMADQTCVPTTGSGATQQTNTVPDLSDVHAELQLRSEILPGKDGSIPSTAETYIGAWLDIPNGVLDDGGQADEYISEFRPKLIEKTLGGAATWIFARVAGTDCVAISPLAGGSASTVIRFKDGVGDVSVQFVNHGEPAHAAHAARPGASYDFELLYHLLANRPPIPPIPYLVFKVVGTELQLKPSPFSNEVINARTGINCGPGTNPKPKG